MMMFQLYYQILLLHCLICTYSYGYYNILKRYNRLSSFSLSSSIQVLGKISKIIPNDTNSNTFRCKFDKRIKYLTRVSRVESHNKWIREIEIIRDKLNNNSIVHDEGMMTVIELSKELLYSGIPEQCIELYAAYYDMILSSNKNYNNITTSINFPVVENPNLILIVTRAFIALDDLKNALKLLQATSRYGVEFDINSKSLLLNDLAKNISPQGLRAALQLRKSMVARNEEIQSSGVLGLLEGISKLLLDQSHHDKNKVLDGQNILLASANQNLDVEDEWGTRIKISPQSAFNLAVEIVDNYLALKKDEKNMNRKIIEEFLRISFRTGAALTKAELDRNYEINIYDERVQKTSNGIILTLETMAKYNVTNWNLNIANMFIDEALRIGDVEGIELIVEQMVSKNLYAHTSTFNKLLQRYASNGDCEAAYECFNTIMMSDNSTKPDSDSIDLLLQSCIQSKKGRYLADQFLKKFCKSYDLKLLSKSSFNSLIQMKILNNESYGDIMETMIISGKQPDDNTITNAMRAFADAGSISGAIHLYKLQTKAEERRRVYRYQRAVSPISNSDNENIFSSSLPPPSRNTVHVLLEILRDNKMYEKSIEVLDDMCKRATYAKLFRDSSADELKMADIDIKPMSIALTPSAEFVLSMQYEPDETTFSLVIEACIAAEKGDLAMEVYSLLETWGLKPNRRVYSALILAFGLLNDIPSSLGVFQEMLTRFTPDVANLQSIIDVCLNDNPYDIRSLSIVIDKMVEDGLDLEVYSKDILFQGFPDALELGSALEMMMQQQLPTGFEKKVTSLTTIGVLVQAVRKGSSLSDLKEALNYIGKLGIVPDDETMDYFRIPDVNSPHVINDLIPKRKKFRSLLDIDMPDGYAADLSLPFRGSSKHGTEPYFEFQQDRFKKHAKALQKSIKGESREDILDDLDDDNAFYQEKDKSKFMDSENNDNELVGDEIIAKMKVIEKKTIGGTSPKRTDKRNSNQREILKRLSDAYNKNQ